MDGLDDTSKDSVHGEGHVIIDWLQVNTHLNFVSWWFTVKPHQQMSYEMMTRCQMISLLLFLHDLTTKNNFN